MPAHKREPGRVAALHTLHVLGYAIFFLRSAQRFFIAKDIRLRASGVNPPRRRPSLGWSFALGTPREEEPIAASASIARWFTLILFDI